MRHPQMILMDVKLAKCDKYALQELASISCKAYLDHYTHMWYDEGQWYINKSFNILTLESEMSDLDSDFFFIEYQKNRVGFVKLNWCYPDLQSSASEDMELERIYLLGEMTGKGIGKAVLQEVIYLARREQKSNLWLKSMDSGKAVDFYRKMGFQQCGTHRLDYEMMIPEYRGMYVFCLPLKNDRTSS